VTTNEHLVLAAGGLAGIAWETGILRGIADTSPVR
jgi:NTE family protein